MFNAEDLSRLSEDIHVSVDGCHQRVSVIIADGVVACALGWGCWKTYVGRPETDSDRVWAMTVLANGLNDAKFTEESLAIYEAGLATAERVWPHLENVVQRDNLASCYNDLGRYEEALKIHREIYAFETARNGFTEGTLTTALNISMILCDTERYSEAAAFSSKGVGESTRLLGFDHDITLRLRSNYAMAIYMDPYSSLQDLTNAVETMENVLRVRRRVFGDCPRTTSDTWKTEAARAILAERTSERRETPS